MPFYDPDKIEILIDEETLQAKIKEIADRISEDYRGRELVLICVLKGSYLFLADLSRAIDLPLEIDFIGVSSYGDGFESSGVVRMVQDLSNPIAGKDVLIVEDIIDSGLTMQYLLSNLSTRRPRSLKVVSLLCKPSKAKVDIPVEYLGFAIDDRFVIGYGLDYENRFRNLPFIAVNLSSTPPLTDSP